MGVGRSLSFIFVVRTCVSPSGKDEDGGSGDVGGERIGVLFVG